MNFDVIDGENDSSENNIVVMSVKDSVMIFLFGICLPSFDVYSDLVFCINYYCYIFDPKHSETPREITLIPIISSTIFLIPHWWKMEGNRQNRIYTLPMLLLLCWPQYRMAKILHMGWKKKGKYLIEKDTFDREINHIGKKKYSSLSLVMALHYTPKI